MPGFLDLPPELRNAIYSYTESLLPTQHALTATTRYRSRTFLADGGNEIHNDRITGRYIPADPTWFAEWARFGVHFNPTVFPIQPSITQVCRQNREETLPMFYGGNKFEFVDVAVHELYGIKTPFLALLLRWLRAIQAHVPLFEELAIDATSVPELLAQRPDENVAALMDLGLPFKEGALVVGRKARTGSGWFENP